MNIKSYLNAVFIVIAMLLSSNVLADTWITFQPSAIENLPNGNVSFWSSTPYNNGCGIISKPFQVISSLHGVTQDGVNGILSGLLSAYALGKTLNVHFFENEPTCTVDAITLLK